MTMFGFLDSTSKKGFTIAAALLCIGMALQLVAGPVAWGVFAWPANIIALCALLALSVVVWLLRRRFRALRFLGTLHAAIPAIASATALTILMGLMRQQQEAPSPGDSLGLTYMLGHWSFVLTYLYIVVILMQALLNEAALAVRCRRSPLAPRLPALLCHTGLVTALVCGTLGNADMQRLKMICIEGQPEWRAIAQGQDVVELPMTIRLKRFIMEQYANGSPRRFASEIEVVAKSGRRLETTIDVNRPAEIEGWKIYQYGYDTEPGFDGQAAPPRAVSILEFVADPWMPWVYAGIFMMMAGAVCMMLTIRR